MKPGMKADGYWLARIWEILTGNAGTGIDGDISVDGVPVVGTDTWRSIIRADEALNDSDKTIVVPADHEWQILSVWVELISTASAGDRVLAVEIQDSGGDVIAQARVGAAQAASLTRYYQLSPSCADLLTFRDTDYLMTSLPFLILPGNSIIRTWDVNAVDAAADDMVVQMLIAERVV